MNEELTQKLIEKFPKLYSKNFYFSVGDGWYNILFDLSSRLSELMENMDDETKSVLRESGVDFEKTCLVAQCKEKFGSLRYYLNAGGSKEMNDLINAVEDIAGTVCELCGKSGKIRPGGWIKCLCDEHDKERKK